MNDPQKTKGPEFVSAFSGPQFDAGAVGQSGTVYFNNARLSPKDPNQVIKGAIASGDTMQKRIKECFESLLPEQK